MGDKDAMKKVVFRGPVLTQSGYGVHSRQVARWLLGRNDIETKFMVTPWGDTSWILDKNMHDGLIGSIMERTVGPDYKADVSIQLQLPNEWDPKLANKNVGITASVETDRSNPEWLKACNSMSSVIFPSEHAKKSITYNGELNVPSYVIPESFIDEISRVKESKISEFQTPFNFLVFGQMTGSNPHNDRKNLLYTLKWLCETFDNDPDVGIALKTNCGRNTKIDRNLVLRTLKAVINEVRKGPYPKIHLVHGDMDDHAVASLYQDPGIKALVSLTRGEGFGLPILEAAASGLPVIATNWSAHTEFLKDVKFIPVDYSLTSVHQSRIDGKIFVQGSRWAEPSENDFKKKILKFRNSASTPKTWANEAAPNIRENYGFTAIAKKYENSLGSLFI